MKNIKWFSVPALALCMAAPLTIKAAAQEQYPANPQYSQPQYQDQDRGDWQRYPDDYRDAQRQGFHEGMEAARHDYMDRRRADADDHQMYKHPPVRGDEAKRDFREGFKEGYRRAMDHMRNGGDRDRDRDRDDRRRDDDQPHF
ncbi:hypothetical protein [Occallatibacter savannae]|uniref:hypothetical protein n=1 Tax=Occallatibacter savannae TaxID=1002691 RepID=UPI0013A56ED3|nr:hypothetical protein [Occallatibacter savannae]